MQPTTTTVHKFLESIGYSGKTVNTAVPSVLPLQTTLDILTLPVLRCKVSSKYLEPFKYIKRVFTHYRYDFEMSKSNNSVKV